MSEVESNSEPKYTTIMAVHQALHQKPTEFADTINALLADRIQGAVENKREEVAKRVFGNSDTEVEATDGETGEGEPEGSSEPEPEVTDEETPAGDEANADSSEEEPKVEETPTEE